jgi:hypothetical protein
MPVMRPQAAAKPPLSPTSDNVSYVRFGGLVFSGKRCGYLPCCHAATFYLAAVRGCPRPIAGRSLRASSPPLTRTCLRSAIHGCAGQLRRLPGHGQPLTALVNAHRTQRTGSGVWAPIGNGCGGAENELAAGRIG